MASGEAELTVGGWVGDELEQLVRVLRSVL